MRIKEITAAMCALALSACASLDPNIKALTDSAERQQATIGTAQAASAAAVAEQVKACAQADKDTQATCFMGVALVNGQGGGNRAAAVTLPVYQPRSPIDSMANLVQSATGLGNAWASTVQSRENGKTTRELAHVNADRETSNFATLAGFGAAVSHDNAATAQVQAANQVPTYQLGPGAVMSGGDVTQVGRDQNTGTQQTAGGSIAGHDVNDRHDVTTNCFAGDGAPGGNSGNPGGAGASGAGGAGAAGGSSCH